MNDRETRPEEVTSIDMIDGEFSLTSLIALLMDAANRVPIELRETALVNVDFSYDSKGTIDVTYERPETDEEHAKRQLANQWVQHENDRREMDTYLRLKAKFGDKA